MPPNELNSFTDFCYLFLSIVLEGAPFIFFGTLVSGVIDAYLPPGLIDRWLPRNKPLAVIMSALLGAIFPVCECAIVPVIRRLIKKGLPVSCAITYMLSAPIINPITVISTMNAFQKTGDDSELVAAMMKDSSHALYMTSSRLLIAFIVTVAVGFVVLKIRNSFILKPSLLAESEENSHDHEHSHDHDHDHSHDEGEKPDKLVQAMRTALRDFLETAMYFTIGVAITALFKAYVTDGMIVAFNQSEYIGVNLMMILAFVLSLCSTSDAFIAANFPVPLSAKLAFLVFGPMMDVKLVFMYLAVFRKKFLIGLATCLFVSIGAISYFWVSEEDLNRMKTKPVSPTAVIENISLPTEQG